MVRLKPFVRIKIKKSNKLLNGIPFTDLYGQIKLVKWQPTVSLFTNRSSFSSS